MMTGIDARPMQASAVARFYVCMFPDFYQTMDACDRDLYRWMETLNPRPQHMQAWMARVSQAVNQRRMQQWLACEAGRNATPPQPMTGLNVAIATKLDGAVTSGNAQTGGMNARINVSFSPRSAPAQCPSIPFHRLRKVNRVGVNYYPGNTIVEFTGTPPTPAYEGEGPWAGGKVYFIYGQYPASITNLIMFFHQTVRIRSAMVFDHWVEFAFPNPEPTAALLARSEPFDIGALRVNTQVPYYPNNPAGQRGHSWRIFNEFTRTDDGQSWAEESWFEYSNGWNPVGLGGYAFDDQFGPPFPACDDIVDGVWHHRVCVYDFNRIPTQFSVEYTNDVVETGTSSITPVAGVPYTPGTPGIASVEETVTVRTVGATKASFRIIGIEPVPGFGVRFTIKVINQLHVPACIVTSFLSGLGDSADWTSMHFYMPRIFVVRNLAAHTESAPVSIMVPMKIYAPGNWNIRLSDWARYQTYLHGYAAPFEQFQDGIYGIQTDGYGNRICPYPNIDSWPPPCYKVSSNPDQYAYLLACYLQNGDKAWVWSPPPPNDDRLLATMPVMNAPGIDVPYARDPTRSDGNAWVSSDEYRPFMGFFNWTAEYLVNPSSGIWEPRSGSIKAGLDLAAALSRYGRTMTLPVAGGRPMWLPSGSNVWITVFESWPGGDIYELEAHLINTYVLPQFPSDRWRNFQYVTVKPPYLTAGMNWWFASSPFNDNPYGIMALTLIKESSSADAIDVALVGY